MNLSLRQLVPQLPSGRRTGYGILAAGIVISGLFAVRGPQGIQTLLTKHREIRRLEEENAAQMVANQRRRERIDRLEHSTAEQEMEIRKQLKLLRPGETTFILPTPAEKTPTPADERP